jgi:hypothetical protein
MRTARLLVVMGPGRWALLGAPGGAARRRHASDLADYPHAAALEEALSRLVEEEISDDLLRTVLADVLEVWARDEGGRVAVLLRGAPQVLVRFASEALKLDNERLQAEPVMAVAELDDCDRDVDTILLEAAKRSSLRTIVALYAVQRHSQLAEALVERAWVPSEHPAQRALILNHLDQNDSPLLESYLIKAAADGDVTIRAKARDIWRRRGGRKH